MSAEPAKEESTFEEVVEILEPHASVIKLGLALFAFAFVVVSIFRAQSVSASHLTGLVGRDIGTTTVGSTLFISETSEGSNYDLKGNGSDIWGTSDSFRYIYIPAPSGDFEFTSRIDYVENDNSWTKGGLMVRASTAPNSPYLFIFSTPSTNGVNVQARSLTGLSSYVVGTSAVTAFPKWVKLRRGGGFLTAYVSTNGSTFTQVGGSSIINLGSAPLLGMAVTSHSYGNLSLVKFRDVKLVVSSATSQPPLPTSPTPTPSPSGPTPPPPTPVPPLPASSNVDDDGDGFSNNAEGWIGTDRSAACPTSSTHKAWPPDMNNDGSVTMADIDIVKNPAWFNSAWGDGRFQARYDLYVDGKINIQDITALLAPVRYLDKKCGSQSTTPTADLRPDLAVTNFTLSTTNPAPGQIVTASVTIQNKGLKLSPCGGYGDVDMNGGINYTDSQLILRYTAGETTLLSGEKLVRANVNGGVINSTDALEVMRFYEGQLTTFQAVCGTAIPPTQPVTGTFNYIFSNTSAISSTCALSWDGQFAGMKAGEIRTVSFNFTAPSTAGSYKASMFIDNTCRVAETDENNNGANVNYTLVQPCLGTPVLQIVPVSVEKGKNIELSAGGLSNCSSSDVIKFDSTTGGGVWDKPLVNCNLGLAGNGHWGCSASFTADWSAGGPYSVRALLDKGGNGTIEDMSNVVNVTVTAPSAPVQPPGPVTGAQDKWGFREYAKTNPYFQRDINVPNYGPANLGMFLFGLAGCESTWTSSSDGYFKGLHQYLLSTWAASNSRRLGYIPNIYDGYIQMDNTAWMIVEGGYSINGQWPGCTDGGAVYPREWTWFLDEW